MKPIVIEYNAESGICVPDGQVIGIAEQYLENAEPGERIIVSSALLLDAFRMQISNGVKSYEEVVFEFAGQTIKLNNYCELEKWPIGFCDHHLIILRTMIEKRRKKKQP